MVNRLAKYLPADEVDFSVSNDTQVVAAMLRVEEPPYLRGYNVKRQYQVVKYSLKKDSSEWVESFEDAIHELIFLGVKNSELTCLECVIDGEGNPSEIMQITYYAEKDEWGDWRKSKERWQEFEE